MVIQDTSFEEHSNLSHEQSQRRIQWNLDITNLYIKKSCLSFGINGAQVISEELTILSKFHKRLCPSCSVKVRHGSVLGDEF